MERKLLDYLPVFIQDYAEIKRIMEAEQVSIEDAWDTAGNVMDMQFILELPESGVKRWESILGIVPKATYTLDERKFNIQTRFNEQLPYTLRTLDSMLQVLCGEGGYSIKLDHNHYVLAIKLALSNQNNAEAVVNLLERIVPANLVKVVSLFNTHVVLSDFTHEQLSAYIHRELREESL